MKKVYLDYAAATPIDPQVLKVMEPYYSRAFYNPAAIYNDATLVKKDITFAKQKIASVLGAKPSEIIHTSGATEANNLAVNGIMQKFPAGKLLVSAIEHESVLNPAGRYNFSEIPVDKTGIINLKKLQEQITDDVVLISVIMVNNEIGSIQPLREIARIIKQVNGERANNKNAMPLYLHSDATQAANYFDLHVSRLGVDLLSLNGGKIYGPKQSGILYIKSQVHLQPQLLGGGQQRGLRSGSESAASVVGMAKALELAVDSRTSEQKRIKKLQEIFINGLKTINEKITINGSAKHISPAYLSATFPGVDNERLLFQLDAAGILVASGSACSASSDEPSHVLKAIGLSDKEARSTLRFTLGRRTTEEDIDYTIRVLKRIINQR